MGPLVSVGIPTYERVDGLRKALRCITGQTYRNLEIIVSDNCTPGLETDQMMNGIVSEDARVSYYKQLANIGVAANFAFVLERASGKYFVWAADDDLCDAQFVEKIVETMEAQPGIVLCGCDVRVIDEADELMEVHRLESIRPSKDWNQARSMFFRYPAASVYFCVYGIYRTEELRHCGLDLMKGWKGLLTNWEVPFLAKLTRSGRIAAIPELLKTYRAHSRSVYNREKKSVSSFDSFMVPVVVRARLCKLALTSAGSVRQRLSLLVAVSESFCGPLTMNSVARTVARLVRKRHRSGQVS